MFIFKISTFPYTVNHNKSYNLIKSKLLNKLFLSSIILFVQFMTSCVTLIMIVFDILIWAPDIEVLTKIYVEALVGKTALVKHTSF